MNENGKIFMIEYQIPVVSAKSWALLNTTSGRVIWLKDAHRKREVASLTKIMTCHVSLLLAERFKLDIYNLYFRVSERASKTIGTTANLIEGDQVILFSLFKLIQIHQII